MRYIILLFQYEKKNKFWKEKNVQASIDQSLSRRQEYKTKKNKSIYIYIEF